MLSALTPIATKVPVFLRMTKLWVAVIMMTSALVFTNDRINQRISNIGEQISEARRNRYALLDVANDLHCSVDMLTEMARLYCSTGHERFQRYFETILAIRAGTKPIPANYTNAYWASVIAHDKPIVTSNPVVQRSLLDRLLAEHPTESELRAFQDSLGQSEQLVSMQREAMALVSQSNGSLAKQTETMRLLESPAFLKEIAEILGPIEEFREMLDLRTFNAIGSLEKQVRRLSALSHLIVIFTTVMLALGVVANDQLVVKPALMKQKRLIEKEVKAREYAQSSNRAKSEFLANMSHEIRTPMNGMIGMLELLEATPLNKDQKEFVTTITFSVESLLCIVNDILDFSKIEANKFTLDVFPTSLRSTIRESINIERIRAEEKGIRLTTQVSADVPDNLRLDPVRLRQILLNLIGNAIKFTEKGEIALTVELERQSGCEVALHFCVKDTGIGIPPDKLTDIFSAFSQADNSTCRKYGGTGLGLAIVTKLVELMQGRVWVESQVGEGSAFNFTIVCEAVCESAQRVERVCSSKSDNADEDAASPLPPMKILLVEDNPVNQKVAARMLQRLNLDCDVAQNGVEGIEMLERQSYDVVLMDIHMPVMDGVEATRIIRRKFSGSKSRIPIIAITADALHGDRERYLAMGVDDYIPKPLRLASLQSALKRVICEDTAEDTAKDTAATPSTDTNPPKTHGPETVDDCGAFESHDYFDVNAALERIDGDSEFLDELINSYVTSVDELTQNLKNAVASQDTSTVHRIAHTLKSVASTLGCHPVYITSFKMEKLASTDCMEEAIELLPQLIHEMGCFRSAVNRYELGRGIELR